MPFANAEDAQVEGWVNENKPIINNLTLLDVLHRNTFYIAIDYPLTYAQNKLSEDLLLPPFSYPYGTEQHWNNVQDDMWLDDAAIEIAATKIPAYFVRPDSGAPAADTDRFFVVVAMRDGFRKEHDNAWRRLTKAGSFLAHLYDNPQNIEPDAKCECKIVDHPTTHPALEAHKIEEHELVLLVHRPQKAEMDPDYVVRDFATRTEADCALKQDSEQTAPRRSLL
ncbi:hypothetical protein GGI35DRAFT_482183 [Trichoderma velutinum]